MRRRGRSRSDRPAVSVLWVLSSLLVLWETGAKGDEAGRVSTPDEALVAVKDCMARNPAPWPNDWRQEYLDTICKAISIDPNAPEFPRRLEIVRRGFALYWADLKNTPERSHFEVRRAEIRWYVENLMASPLPGGMGSGIETGLGG